MNARPRLEALTGLRYVAALTILVAHMTTNLPAGSYRTWLWTLSAVGMPLFFTLSGFLMAYNYSAAFQARYGRTLRSFYVARVARIYPVYLLCLLIYFSFIGNFWHDVTNRPADTAKSLAFVATGTQAWVHVPVFTDYFNPRTVCLSYLPVAWSVSVEAFFYAVFPLVVLPVARWVTRFRHVLFWGGAAFAGCMAANYLLVRTSEPLPRTTEWQNSRLWWSLYFCPYIRFAEFLTGAVVGQYFLRTGERPAGGRAWWGLTAALVAAVGLMAVGNKKLVLGSYNNPTPTVPLWLQMSACNVLYAPLCAVVVYYLAAVPSAFRRAMGCRAMVVLGEMSYCMYLLHPLAQSFYVPRVGGEATMTQWYVILYNNLAMVVVLHLLCLGMYRYWEVPARTFLRDRLDPKPAPKLAVVRPGDARAA